MDTAASSSFDEKIKCGILRSFAASPSDQRQCFLQFREMADHISLLPSLRNSSPRS